MGAATPNPRTCRVLTHRDGLLILSFIPLSSARREAPLGVLPQEFRQTARQHLILGPLGLRNRVLYFQEREFSGQRKAEVASPIECRFRRDGRLVGPEPLSLKSGCSFETDQ